ncbi:MAG: hypothetical protein QOJ42_944, partial [Acidobacteriaceae bacterium]|nr:hypothetical protein [Acidobacteriaceae bacterium]
SAAVNPDNPFGPLIEVQVATLDPATGKVLMAVPTSMFYAALAFDASNGLLVGGTGSGNTLLSGDIFMIDPMTGNQIAHVSDTGLDFLGDLDFRPVPEPASDVGRPGLGSHSFAPAFPHPIKRGPCSWFQAPRVNVKCVYQLYVEERLCVSSFLR